MASKEGLGSTIVRYKLLEELDEDDLGTTYLAEQQEPVHRRVSVRLMKREIPAELIERFQEERRKLARLDHPAVARVIDVGTTESGRNFFAAELVLGERITDYCNRVRMEVSDRLKLFQAACAAVQHAHQKGVIHGALEPSRVRVVIVDEKPVTRVTDFGIGASMGSRLAEDDPVGVSPDYAAPEQAWNSDLDVDTRADVYGLGALLYELLTGAPPLDLSGAREASLREMLRLLSGQEPPSPSERLKSLGAKLEGVAHRRGTGPKALTHLVQGDLDAIVMRALAKDRERRHETAHALAIDVQRYLDGELVLAPPDKTYVVRRQLWHHRYFLFGTAAVVLLLAAGLAATARQLAGARAQRDREAARRTVAERRFDHSMPLLSAMLIGADVEAMGALGTTKAHEMLVRRSIEFLDAVAVAESDDPDFQAGVADTYLRLARVQGNPNTLQDFKGALESLKTAAEIGQRLVTRNPNEKKRLQFMAEVHTETGVTLATLGRLAEAQESFNQTLRLLRRLDASYVERRMIHFRIGHLLVREGRYQEALERYRPGLDYCRGKVLDREAASRADLTLLLVAQRCVARSLRGLERLDEALRNDEEALGVAELLLERHPEDSGVRRDVARQYAAIGEDLLAMERSMEALPLFDRALNLLRELARDEGDHLGVELALTEVYYQHGHGYATAGFSKESPPELRTGLLRTAGKSLSSCVRRLEERRVVVFSEHDLDLEAVRAELNEVTLYLTELEGLGGLQEPLDSREASSPGTNGGV